MEKKYNDALDIYKQVLAVDPKDPDAVEGVKRLEKAIKAIADSQN